MPRPKCCLCGYEIKGKPVQIPADAHGNRVLPPECAKRAREKGAPASGWLHSEKNHWCVHEVYKERPLLRSKMVVRGGYDPGAVPPHLAAGQQPREQRNLGAVNVDGPAALGVLLVATPSKEEDGTDSPATQQPPPAKRQRLDAGSGASGSSSRCCSAPCTRPRPHTPTPRPPRPRAPARSPSSGSSARAPSAPTGALTMRARRQHRQATRNG